MDKLVKEGYCFAKPGEVFAVYFPAGASKELMMKDEEGSYSVKWYNPRKGGELQNGSIETVKAERKVDLGNPPVEMEQDWVCLIKKVN